MTKEDYIAAIQKIHRTVPGGQYVDPQWMADQIREIAEGVGVEVDEDMTGRKISLGKSHKITAKAGKVQVIKSPPRNVSARVAMARKAKAGKGKIVSRKRAGT